MKKSAFTAIFTITAMVLSSLITPCRAQVPESLVEGMTVDKDPVYICEEVDEDMVFITYETQPEFPGGSPALLAYIKNELRYPKKCRAAGVEGRTIITFVVKKNGKVKNFEVARSSGDKLLDKEAVRVIKKMPKWKPGMHDGKNVNTRFTLPINFKLR